MEPISRREIAELYLALATERLEEYKLRQRNVIVLSDRYGSDPESIARITRLTVSEVHQILRGVGC